MKPTRLYKTARAMTLLEVMIAVSIFAITLLGFLLSLVGLQYQNRIISQREQAMGQAREIMEIIKTLGYANIRYSTGRSESDCVCLKSAPHTRDTNRLYANAPEQGQPFWMWAMPMRATDWQPLYTAALNGDGQDDMKLPDAEWTVNLPGEIVQAGPPQWAYRQITVQVRWRTRPASGNWHTVTLDTFVAPRFTAM